MDEPENSLTIVLQKDLCQYISDSARHFDGQLYFATHSLTRLSMADALICNLDEEPVSTKKWTELEIARMY